MKADNTPQCGALRHSI